MVSALVNPPISQVATAAANAIAMTITVPAASKCELLSMSVTDVTSSAGLGTIVFTVIIGGVTYLDLKASLAVGDQAFHDYLPVAGDLADRGADVTISITATDLDTGRLSVTYRFWS